VVSIWQFEEIEMRMLHRNVPLAFLAVLLSAVIPAFAADDIRLRATIVQVTAAQIEVKSADGRDQAFSFAPDTLITRNEPSSLSAVKPGDFIASGATMGSDGKLRSTEVRIFPEAMRGLGEGQRPMQEPGKIMTNAAVTEVVAAPQGQTVKVKFKGGVSELIVGPNVPVIAVVAADRSALKVGEHVFVLGSKQADGTLLAKRVLAM
jgi:hypothetical protein